MRALRPATFKTCQIVFRMCRLNRSAFTIVLAYLWTMTPSVIVAAEQSRTASHPAVQTDQSAEKQPTDKRPAKNPTEYRFVFIGNSHSIIGTPFDHLQKMIKARDDKPTVSGQTVAVDFLDALEAHKSTWKKPDFATPGILVLQGQKISMSGRYSYSTQTATDIARIFSEKGTKVLLFAEWGQAGVAGDGAVSRESTSKSRRPRMPIERPTRPSKWLRSGLSGMKY